jgi:sugar phosphate isomerase/epimerase
VPDLSKLALNQATTRVQWGFRDSVEGYSRAGVRAISVWTDKVAAIGLPTAKKLLNDYGMRVPALCFGEMPGVLTPQRGTILLDRARAALDVGAELGADCFVMMLGAAGEAKGGLEEARRRACDFLASLLPHARSVGVTLGIEPVHPMRAGDLMCVNTLRQANLMCGQLGQGTGVVVDTYHVWWDPDLGTEIANAAGRIVSFQVSDWLAQTLLTGNDRGMPGDGLIDIAGIWRQVRAAGYLGPCEVELMSERDWWRRDPDEVVRVCIARFGDLVRQVAPDP